MELPGYHDHRIGPEPRSFWTRYVFSQDHKVIALQYTVTALLVGAIGMVLSWAIRLELAFPGTLDPGRYYQAMTLHGMIMGSSTSSRPCSWGGLATSSSPSCSGRGTWPTPSSTCSPTGSTSSPFWCSWPPSSSPAAPRGPAGPSTPPGHHPGHPGIRLGDPPHAGLPPPLHRGRHHGGA